MITEQQAEEVADSILEQIEQKGVKVLNTPDMSAILLKRDPYQSVLSRVVSHADKKTLLFIAGRPELLDVTNKFDVKISTMLLIHGDRDVLAAVNSTRASQQLRKGAIK